MRLPALKKWDVVEVQWVDSTHVEGWQDEPPPAGLPIDGCLTVGMFHSATETTLTVVGTRDQNEGRCLGVLSIPVACLQHVRRLG